MISCVTVTAMGVEGLYIGYSYFGKGAANNVRLHKGSFLSFLLLLVMPFLRSSSAVALPDWHRGLQFGEAAWPVNCRSTLCALTWPFFVCFLFPCAASASLHQLPCLVNTSPGLSPPAKSTSRPPHGQPGRAGTQSRPPRPPCTSLAAGPASTSPDRPNPFLPTPSADRR